MCKKLIFLALAITLLSTSSIQAANIIVVGDGGADDDWVAFLEENGHTISYTEDYWRTLDEDKLAELEAADLVIVMASCSSNQYDDGNEEEQWGSVTTPILNLEVNITRNSVWQYINSGTRVYEYDPMLKAVLPNHKIFMGVSLDGSNLVDIVDEDVTSRIRTLGTIDVGNGTLIATVNGASEVLIAEWEGGAACYEGGYVQAGPRMLFHGVADTGAFNLNAQGQILFLNMIKYLTGEGFGAANVVYPPNNSIDIPLDAVLSWTAGEYADTHNVYFSTDFNDVNEKKAIALVSPNQTGITYDPLVDLEYGMIYYWAIDEVNAPPDSSVHPGRVWSFTTEPEGYPIDGDLITATASSEASDDYDIENTINESGITGDFHDTNDLNMWLSADPDTDPCIVYEFDKIYKLHQMLVWNYNVFLESLMGNGLMDVTVQYSLDGKTWDTLSGVPQFAQGTEQEEYEYNTTVEFNGVKAKYVKLIPTSNYSWGTFEQYGLSEVRFLYIPVWVRNPVPRDGTNNLDPDVTFGFISGRGAESHDLYLSTNQRMVEDGTVVPTNIPAGGSNITYGPVALDLSKTYYWKVNETIEGYAWEGDVWEFSTTEYLVVENFEDYNDFRPDRIFQTWLDGYGYTNADSSQVCGNGTGSSVGNEGTPYAEQTIRFAGAQSMPLAYDNSGNGVDICGNPINVYYSEARREFDEYQDWTVHGIAVLRLHFYGDPNNDFDDPMWVKLTDSSNTSDMVTYGTYADEDVKNIAIASWHQWDLALEDFGIDLSEVNKISIGFGDPGASSKGGSGKVYIDEIRLYSNMCLPNRVKPAGDINNDCIVDYDELESLADEWLSGGFIVTPQDPGTSKLIGYWPFNNNTTDESVNNNHAVLNNGGVYVIGYDDKAIQLDGTDDYIDLPVGTLISSLTDCTFAAWTSFGGGGSWKRLFDFGNSETVNMFLTPDNGSSSRFAITIAGNAAETQLTADDLTSGWHHMAVTFDSASATISMYIDGELVDDTTTTLYPKDLGETTNNWIGRSQYAADAYYNGVIDEFRIYNRALSIEEIAWLMGKTEVYSVPLDYNVDDIIDFKDYAILASDWMEEELWPVED